MRTPLPFVRQPINPAGERSASGRSASPLSVPAGRTPFAEIVRRTGSDAPGEPSDLLAPGRHPSSMVEMDHAQASLSDTALGRPVSGLHARRLGDADADRSASLLHLARRLTHGSQNARRIADNAEILSHRLQRELPHPSAGLAYAVNEHVELSDTLADAHAVVIRMAAYPEILDVLSALEQGAEVTVRMDEGHAPSPSLAAGNRSARTGAVGGEHNPTPRRATLWSGLIEAVAGHRKSSTPAHVTAPAPAMSDHRTGDFQHAGKAFQRSGNDRAR